MSTHSAKVETYSHIVEVRDHGAHTRGKSYICALFSRYLSPTGEYERQTITWHGPYRSRREISALLQGNAAPPPTQAASPTSTQTDL